MRVNINDVKEEHELAIPFEGGNFFDSLVLKIVLVLVEHERNAAFIRSAEQSLALQGGGIVGSTRPMKRLCGVCDIDGLHDGLGRFVGDPMAQHVSQV